MCYGQDRWEMSKLSLGQAKETDKILLRSLCRCWQLCAKTSNPGTSQVIATRGCSPKEIDPLLQTANGSIVVFNIYLTRSPLLLLHPILYFWEQNPGPHWCGNTLPEDGPTGNLALVESFSLLCLPWLSLEIFPIAKCSSLSERGVLCSCQGSSV